MLSNFLPAFLVGAITFSGYTLNTLFWVLPILLVALVKLILPIKIVSRICNKALNFFASSWVSGNTLINRLTKNIHWQVDIPSELNPQQWYLVVANHQSWVDILVVQQVFNKKIPFLKFFLKRQLFWVPVLGLAWWALDFPFMKRYSKSYLKKNPHKKGMDFKNTQKACEKFKVIPISIMNFAEGTRFSPEKKLSKKSPYQYLLKPKSGGIGYVLTLMGNEINHLLNVTIKYPEIDKVTFWGFISGKIKQVHITAELIKIPDEIKGNFIEDSQVRVKTQQWLNQLWAEKDRRLGL